MTRQASTPRAKRMIPELNKSDLQKCRTQADLRAYVDGLRDQFGATKEGKRAARLKQGKLVKEFVQEIWILALFADAFYKGRLDVLFQPVVSNDSYDALLRDASSHRLLHHLQIPQSYYDADQKQRMLHLEEYGHVPLIGPKLQKNKGIGEVPETWTGETVTKSLQKSFERIQCAVERKKSMRPEADMFLIVGFEDMDISSESDRADLDRFARSELVRKATNFAALYLVSGWRRLAFRYGVRACNQVCCRGLP